LDGEDSPALSLGVLARFGTALVTPADVTAVLVTRGDVDLAPILATLPYGRVVLWDGSRDGPEAYGMFVRYLAITEASTEVVYVQDDDCIFERHAELVEAYRPGVIVSTYGHGDNADGLDDFVLMHGGAIFDRELVRPAFERYLNHFPRDDAFYRYADLVFGGLTPFEHVELEFTIDYSIATRPNRMANQEWARGSKHTMAERVRAVRDMVAA
jgi:hypothetical protein